MDGSKPSYTQDEVNEILKRALAQEAGKERVLDHDDLVEVAHEAGIDREALERAMAEIAQERTQELARQSQASEIAAERRVQMQRLGASLLSHAALNGVLYWVCMRTGGGWYIWPMLGSAIVLAMKLRHVISPHEKLERRRRKRERERERAQRRAEREEFKRKILGAVGNPSDNAKAFENVVQVGVSALLALAEKKISEHKERELSKPRKLDR